MRSRLSAIRITVGNQNKDDEDESPDAPLLKSVPTGPQIVLPSYLLVKEHAASFWWRYRLFLSVTAILHLISGFGALAIVIKKDWPVRLCASYTVWTPTYDGFKCFSDLYNVSGVLSATGNGTKVFNPCNRISAWKHAGTIYPSALVISFFFLSFFFQIVCVITNANYARYKKWLLMGVQPLRFIEYSVSSTVMIIVIALLNGQTDIWLIVAIVGCNWSTMIFGLLSEQIMRIRGEYVYNDFLGNVGAHLAGWVPFVAVWTIITSQFYWSLDAASKVPDVVKAIPAVQLALFAVFGFNQALGIRYLYPPPNLDLAERTADLVRAAKEKDIPFGERLKRFWRTARWTYMTTEISYTILSLTAKSLLAWMLLGGSIMQDPKKLVAHSLC